MTTPTPTPPPTVRPSAPSALPPDPAQYDTERNEHARKRGLSAPYISGGRDPNPEAGKAEERRYLRWLLVMVVILILAAFVVGFIANALGFTLPGYSVE